MPVLVLSAWINRHETGTLDRASPVPTHKDGANGDVIEMLPLVSCVISHFE